MLKNFEELLLRDLAHSPAKPWLMNPAGIEDEEEETTETPSPAQAADVRQEATDAAPKPRISAMLGLNTELALVVDQIEAKNTVNLELLSRLRDLFDPPPGACKGCKYRIRAIALRSHATMMDLLSLCITTAENVFPAIPLRKMAVDLAIAILRPVHLVDTADEYWNFSLVQPASLP